MHHSITLYYKDREYGERSIHNGTSEKDQGIQVKVESQRQPYIL